MSIRSAGRPLLRVVAMLCVWAAGCAADHGPTISLGQAGPPSVADRCAAPGKPEGPLNSEDAPSVRVTLVSRDAAGAAVDFCDRVFDFGKAPALSVPAKGAATVDIFAEAWGPSQSGDPVSAGNVRRLSTGSLLGLGTGLRDRAALRMYATERFLCAGAQMINGRAFHSATRLPDGRVLFVGGLVASPTDPSATAVPPDADGIPATGKAEIYDPRSQTSITVEEPAPAPRAFHAAALVDDGGGCPSGNVAVLLVGGLTSPMPESAILNRGLGLAGGRLTPFRKKGALNDPLPARAASNELLCLDPVANRATRMGIPGAAAAFRAADVGQGGRLVAAGGLDYDFASLNTVVPKQSLDVFVGASPTSGMTLYPRSGASLTILDKDRALLWGGGALTDPIGELVLLNGTPISTALTDSSKITEFHTATLIGGQVLLTGGFEVVSGGVNVQPPEAASAVRLVTVNAGAASSAAVSFSGGYVADPTCSMTMEKARYRPAGWESAIALGRGRVLITGGSPSTQMAANRCADCLDGSSLLCAIDQASIFDTDTLSPAPDKLGVARLGHRSTLLSDGTVLVSGGIGSDGMGNSLFVRDLEVYNPRAPVAPVDVTGHDLDDPIADAFPDVQRTPGKQTDGHVCGEL